MMLHSCHFVLNLRRGSGEVVNVYCILSLTMSFYEIKLSEKPDKLRVKDNSILFFDLFIVAIWFQIRDEKERQLDFVFPCLEVKSFFLAFILGQENGVKASHQYFLAHLCLCTVGSYASLSVRLSVCPSVTGP